MFLKFTEINGPWDFAAYGTLDTGYIHIMAESVPEDELPCTDAAVFNQIMTQAMIYPAY